MDTTWIPWADAALLLFLIGFFTGTVLLTRTFIAHRRALALWEPDRSVLMKHVTSTERSAWWWMAWPCVIGLLLCSAWRTLLQPELLRMPWALAAWGIIGCLLAAHLVNGRLHARFQKGLQVWGTNALRFWSLVPGLLLVALVVIGTQRELRWYQGLLFLITGIALVVLTLRQGGNTHTTDAADRNPRP